MNDIFNMFNDSEFFQPFSESEKFVFILYNIIFSNKKNENMPTIYFLKTT